MLLPGCIYCRISEDDEGLEAGVERQEQDARALALAEGVTVSPDAVFIDNDISASTLSNKPRPAYDEMIARVAAGEFKAVVAYSNSRLTRRPLELERWIELHQKTGVRIVTVVSGEDNLATADGRMVARLKANIDAAEAERTGERVRRAIRQRRDRGQSSVGGIRPFGYDKNDRTQLDPVEAEAIRDGAGLLLRPGGTVGDVMRLWEARGIKPVRAAHWSRRTVQGIYKSPRLAGLYLHDGVLKESANVPGILPRAEWEAVQDAVAPKTMDLDAEHWRRKNLLTDVLLCGNCGSRMQSKGPHYGCLSSYGGCGKNFRKREWLDELINELMIERLKGIPEGAEKTVPGPVSHAGEIERLESLIVETKDAHKAGVLDSGDAFPMIREYREQITALRKEEVASVKAAAETVTAKDSLQLWRSGVLESMRQVLRDEVKYVVVNKIGRGYGPHKPLPVDAIEVVWT